VSTPVPPPGWVYLLPALLLLAALLVIATVPAARITVLRLVEAVLNAIVALAEIAAYGTRKAQAAAKKKQKPPGNPPGGS